MTGKSIFWLTLSLLLAFSFCQTTPDCTKLNFDDDYDTSTSSTQPPGILSTAQLGDTTVTGTCPALKGQQQCCSGTFFDHAQKKLKTQNLKSALHMQAGPQLGLFHLLAKDVNDYFVGTWSADVGSNFANMASFPAVTLNTNPSKDTFNYSAVVLQTLGQLKAAIKAAATNTMSQTCVEAQYPSILTAIQQPLNNFARSIASVRNASTLFFLIDQYLVNVTDDLIALVPPTDQCANILLKLTCGKCQKSLPKLCGNVCGAAAKGCLAPYVAALNPQFNILWNVTTQLVQFLNTTLTQMFAQQDIIRQTFITILNANCGLQLDTLLTVNIRPHGVGVGFLKQAQNLLNSGLLKYNASGPLICNVKTAKSNCWDGTQELKSDTSQFTTDSIPGQAQNPAGSFNEAEMTQQAQMIGTPVNNFFSTVSEVVPSAITIPQGQVYSGATTASVSVLLLFLIALFI